MLSPVQREVAAILSESLRPLGFAFGGGAALQMHGVVDRSTKDLDAYSSVLDDGSLYAQAEHDLTNTLTRHGFHVERTMSDTYFRAFVVWKDDPEDGVVVDIGYDYRQQVTTVDVPGIGPVLDLGDITRGKIRALTDRTETRDYFDIDALLTSGHLTPEAMFDIVQDIRPELTRAAFVAILRRATLLPQEDFDELGLDVHARARLVGRLAAAADTITAPSVTTPPHKPVPAMAPEPMSHHRGGPSIGGLSL